ncbi:unnamed protein product [Scytosiphon promiscuus]
MLLARRCPNAATVGRRPAALRRLTRRASSKPSQETGRPRHASRSGAGAEIPFLNAFPQGQQRQPQQPCPQQQQQQQHPRQQRHRDERQLPPTQPGSPTSPPEAATTTSKSADISTRIGSSSSSSTGSNNKLGLALLMSAVREVSLARRDLGWGVDAVAMRLTMLGFLRHARSKPGAAAIPEEAIMVDGGRDWLDDRASEWERFLMWSHASYGWTEEVVLSRPHTQPRLPYPPRERQGVERDELEVVALSRGKSRNRPMAPTYVLAVDHARREIVLSVRGTKAFGDAITITHFRPEPFLDGYAHRGFAKSAHYLVKEVEPQLISLTDRLPDYRVCFTGHSMGGGIAAMASMLIRDSATRRRRRLQKNQQQHSATTSGPNPPESARTSSATEPGDEERAARGTRDEMPEGSRQDLGVRLGLESAPMVYSFATPCCVSLDLARGCEDWVESIVHGDDAIPRLSTVSLELLKEDMTAAEWRRAIDRLAHLNTVLAPSTKAAAAVAAALKNALAGLGSLSRTQRTPGTAAPAEDVGGGEDSGRRPVKAPAGGLSDTDFESSREGWREERGALPRREEEVVGAARAKRASSLAAESETAEAAGAAAGIGGDGHGSERGRKDGNGGDEKENSKKRDDLGRSIRDTALTMRGLAKLYPLSQSFRQAEQEIASMVAQVVNLTGGETGDGAGAIKPARKVEPSSRPELLLTLKGNLEVLGASRAALHGDDPNGAGAGGKPEAADGTNSDVTRRGLAALDTSAGAADAGPRAATAGGSATGPGAQSASLHDRPVGDGGADGAAARATVDAASSVASESIRESSESASSTKATQIRGAAALSEEGARVGSDDDDRLRCLHESYLARPEPSLLPLYPPGDPFLFKDGGGSSGGGGLGFAVSESMAASSAAAKGAGAGSGEDGVVLVRVPHEHFLRMPLSPSMLEDHSMSSYQRALAGLSKKNPTGPGV